MNSSIKDTYVKHSLGKIVYLFLTLFLFLQAEDFNYDIHINNQNPYEKEALLLDIDINQTNTDIVLFFRFRIHPNSDYAVEQIASSQDNTLHHTHIHTRYLLHPLRSGDINVTFDLIKRVTDDAKVAYSFSGDRDDFKKLETTDSKISLPPLMLKVKPLPKATQLIGDFHLSYTFKKHKADAYEPISVNVTIEGKGYPPLIEALIPKSPNITVFTEKPAIEKKIDNTGIHYKTIYRLALSSNKTFDLPAIQIHAFDPHRKKTYMLEIPKQHFDINPTDINALVDKTDTPARFKNDLSWITTFLTYLIVFAAGYFTALAIWSRKNVMIHTVHPLKEKIASCQDAKSLLQLLMSINSRQFASSIERLEKHLYGNGKINLKKIKQDVLEKIV